MDEVIDVSAAASLRFGVFSEYQFFSLLVCEFEILEINVVFVSPEVIQSKSFREFLSNPLVKQRLAIVAVDEAHCISEWLALFLSNFCMQ